MGGAVYRAYVFLSAVKEQGVGGKSVSGKKVSAKQGFRGYVIFAVFTAVDIVLSVDIVNGLITVTFLKLVCQAFQTVVVALL